jgi:uncharacterized protein YcbX
MAEMRLSEINIYPIKSLKGIAQTEAAIEPRGLAFDRRWMLVDNFGVAMTQREYPRMALVRVELTPHGLLCVVPPLRGNPTPEGEPLLVPYADEGQPFEVEIWDDRVWALTVSREADEWFSRFLGVACHLVRMPETTERRVDTAYAHAGEIVSFADGYPFLLIGQASLDDLNRRLAEPLPMKRFRPNLVVMGAEPFAEDGWRRVQIGDAVFAPVKPCARCELTTVDPDRGVVGGKEPLRTLATFRKVGSKVLFGQNLLLVSGGGTLRVGDPVRMLA